VKIESLGNYTPKENGSFLLPFSREDIAVYLACEKCALSRLLLKIKKEGKIAYRGNRFLLKDGKTNVGY
jgi:CRP-like cAMP-binding protein